MVNRTARKTPMNNVPISVFIITLNEQEHLQEVLESVQYFDEIVLVDSGSSDNTVEIAKRNGAIVHHQSWLGFAKQKAFAMSLCKNKWVFNLDGDEVLTEGLAQRIQTLVNENKADAFRLYFEDVFWGQAMSPQSGKRSIVRVYNKDKVSFPTDRLVHENVKIEKGATEADIKEPVNHYGYFSTEVLMHKQNSYSSLKAHEKFNKGAKPSLLKLTLVFPVMFIKEYFFKRMFLSGRRGLVTATINATYGFLKEAKLHEYSYRNNNKADY